MFKSTKVSAGTKRFFLKSGLVPLKKEKIEPSRTELWVGSGLDHNGDVDQAYLEFVDLLIHRTGFGGAELGPVSYNQQLGKEYSTNDTQKRGISSKLASRLIHMDVETRSKVSALINPSFMVLAMSPGAVETDIENSVRILAPVVGQITLNLDAYSHELVPEGRKLTDNQESMIRLIRRAQRARLDTFSEALLFHKCKSIAAADPTKEFYFTKPPKGLQDPLSWPKIGVKFDYTLQEAVLKLPVQVLPEVLVYKSPSLEAAHLFLAQATKSLPKRVALHLEVQHPVSQQDISDLRLAGYQRVQFAGQTVLDHGPYLLKGLK